MTLADVILVLFSAKCLEVCCREGCLTIMLLTSRSVPIRATYFLGGDSGGGGMFYHHVRQNAKLSECGRLKEGMFDMFFFQTLYPYLQVQQLSHFEVFRK